MEDIKTEVKIFKKVKRVRSKRMMFLSRAKRKILKHVWFVRIALASLVLAVVCLIVLIGVLVFNSLGFGRYTNMLGAFLFTPKDKIESMGGRTNILILGKGGKGHEAPELTDTIIFASISHKGAGITLVSLPRDIWIPQLRAKLNSAYYWGDQKAFGGGLILAKATVEEIVGEPVHYAAVVDFSGLKSVVDLLGSIEVDIENSFVDEKYPISGREGDLCDGDRELKCRYETVSFEKGLGTMDGDTALKFVRSRNAEGDEGDDMARISRQQKVLDAIEKKLFSREVYLSPGRIKGLIALFGEVVETDISDEAGAILARRVLESKNSRGSYVLGEDLLDNPPISKLYDNLYVFVPKAGTWEKVREWIDSLLRGG
ncbi:hypothetical protein A2125_02550 [Candidatus Woesebacteria bacterium GWB1_43_5]|uniref:Cell envelope-related transcriptional attenuator domain-containing protein n=1 Tax=Candidatus Woesebacteria bacterium GWB1_43_5 TaxID=1802474 RepID=A0A1F7WTN8_9BACT|nr:MAG: hypothetical protein A2125_02550 [Candidatus Woesebacteria bacterium GWB1_43_5]